MPIKNVEIDQGHTVVVEVGGSGEGSGANNLGWGGKIILGLGVAKFLGGGWQSFLLVMW